MIQKDGSNYVPPKPSTIRSNVAMDSQADASKAQGQADAKPDAETVPGFEME